MGARADLLAVGGHLAEAARAEAEGGGVERAGEMAAQAKVALEAATLAGDVGTGPITEALDGIQDLLAEAGVIDAAVEMEPREFLEVTFRSLIAWRREALAAAAHAEAYDALRTLTENLERDFIAGGSETSLRLAARIRNALDDATQMINNATRGAANGQASE